jgi:hypothetical protein
MSNAKLPVLRRYTELAPLFYLLQKKELTLLSPRSWDDRNDAFFLEAYRRQMDLQCVLALCFTEAAETYHHWRVFAGSPSGVCLVFDKQRLLASLRRAGDVTPQPVKYMTIADLRKAASRSRDLRFTKRYPFRDEREFRIIFQDPALQLETKDIPFDPAALQQVVVNPWMPRAVYESVRTLIRSIRGWQDLRVERTTLVDNEQWRQLAEDPNIARSNKALQPPTRIRRKTQRQPQSGAARG